MSVPSNVDIVRLTAGLSSVPVNTKGFADTLGAERVPLKISLPDTVAGTGIESIFYSLEGAKNAPPADIYYIDDTTLLYAVPFLAKLYPQSTFIYFFSDHRLFGTRAYNFGHYPFPKSIVKKADRILDYAAISQIVRHYVDGAIAISEMCAERLHQIDPSLPVNVAEGFIKNDIFEDLKKVSPDLSTNIAVTVARGIEAKGTDLLVDAWSQIREEHSNAILHIIGPDQPAAYETNPGVVVHGEIPHQEVPRYLANASLFVNPSRIDAFPIAVLEALLAGLPTIVTETTGSKSVTRDINSDYVVKSTPDSLAHAIRNYFDEPIDRRQMMSEAAVELGRNYDELTKREEFDRTFTTLLEKVFEPDMNGHS